MYLNLKQIKENLGVNSLLTNEGANPKVAKNEKLGVLGAVLHLAPHTLSGYQTCPMSSAGCRASCLMTAGNPAYLKNKTEARIKRTKAFFENREAFMNMLVLELAGHVASSKRQNYDPSIRLNGTSDIRWESVRFNLYQWVAERIKYSGNCQKVTVFDIFPDCQFYDYTKLHNRKKVPSNYHLTFSMNETNQKFAEKQPLNVAVVFAGKLPETYLGRSVIDGDEHDYRPADPSGIVVGLKAKGKGRVDDTGFVIQL
jgi:hypothetical protein